MVVTSYRKWLNYTIPLCAVESVQSRRGRGLGETLILYDVRFKWSWPRVKMGYENSERKYILYCSTIRSMWYIIPILDICDTYRNANENENLNNFVGRSFTTLSSTIIQWSLILDLETLLGHVSFRIGSKIAIFYNWNLCIFISTKK